MRFYMRDEAHALLCVINVSSNNKYIINISIMQFKATLRALRKYIKKEETQVICFYIHFHF